VGLLLPLLALALGSCSEGRARVPVVLPATPVISLRPTWAVVAEPYLRLRAEPDSTASIAGHLRQGDVARIVAISPVVARVNGERRYWYQLAGNDVTGWALETALEAYGTEQRARNASRRLRGGEP